tara:strand:- start:863 stop:1138 length:276 start_codon:yes stop_codon:yes gene_type:complete
VADAIIILKRRVKERSVLRRFFGSAPDPIAFKESDKNHVKSPSSTVEEARNCFFSLRLLLSSSFIVIFNRRVFFCTNVGRVEECNNLIKRR